MISGQYSRGEQLALGGAGLTAVGAFLPWIEASIMGFSESVTGVEGGDGWITLIAATLVAVAVLAGNWGKISRGVTVLFGLIIAAIGLMYISDPATGINASPALEAAISPAIGLYVTALGGAMAVGGGIVGGDDTADDQQQAAQQPVQSGHPGGVEQGDDQSGRQTQQQQQPQDTQQPQSDSQRQPRSDEQGHQEPNRSDE